MLQVSAANDDKPQLYNFTDAETGHVLALVKSQLTFTVNYPLENGTMDSLTFSLSAITPKVKGFLGASRDTKTALMWILWPVANESSNDTAMLADVDADFEQYSAKNVVNLTLAFKSRKDKSVWLESAMLKVPILNNDILKFNMKAKHFGDITSFFFDTALNIQENETPIRFECSTQKYPGTSETATSTATLVMADTSMQAFLPDKQKDFSKDVSVCPLDAKVAVGVGQWQLNETDKMCLLLKGSLTMLLKYQKQGEGHTGLATVPVPSDAKIDSSKSYCGNSSTGDDAVLALTFFNHLWSLRLTFENNNTAGQQFELKTIHIDGSVKNDTIAARYFPDFKDQDIHHKSNANDTYEAFSAKTDTYLMCNAEQTLNVGKAQIVAKSLTMEAFVEPAGKKLTASLCAQDVRTSDLVPIIVGSCLALLVIVVLIAYLIGRHRAKRTGYASV